MEEEIWKDILGFEGRYQVSSFGRVRSLEYHNAKGVKRIGILKPAKDAKGYLRCALSKNNKLITYKVHRLVAAAFISNPNNFLQVNHKNGTKTDNRVENLEWCDNSTNQIHAYRHGLNPHHIGHHTPVVLIDKMSKKELLFPCMKDAALFVGVNRNTIRDWIKRGRNNSTYECKVAYES